MTHMTYQERAEFEHWYSSEGKQPEVLTKVGESTIYKDSYTGVAWAAWQAARRAQAANGKGWGGSGTSMIDGHAVSSETDCMTCSGHGAVGNVINAEPCPDCTPPSHSMSQYASKDDMLKAVMAENEQLRAQLAAVQQGVQQSIEQDVCAIVDLLKNREWAEHIGQTELGRELEHEITKLYNATHPTPPRWGWMLKPTRCL